MANPAARAVQTADIREVIEAVKAEVNDALSVAQHLRLTEFEVEFSVVTKTKTEGGFSFEIPIVGIKIGPEGSASYANSTTTKLTLSYKADAPARVSRTTTEPDPQTLADAIRRIDENVDSPSPDLPLFEGSVSFSFGVDKDASGGLKVVILKFGETVSAGDTHTITLKFKRK